MVTGSQPSENSELQTSRAASVALPEGRSQPLLMEVYPPDDSIDYVEFGAMLWRRRRLIAWVAGVLIALFLLLAIFKKPSYGYTTNIQLGVMVAQDGTLTPLLSPQTAAGLLQSKYIPDAMYQYESQHHMDLRALSVTADADSESTTAIISCKAAGERAAACIAVEKAAAADFVKDNTRAVAAIRAKLQANLDTAKLDLKALQDPTVFGVQKLAAEKAIADARDALTKLQGNEVVLKVHKAKIDASVSLYQKESEQLQTHIADVRKSALNAAAGTSNPTDAMANLLLSTEVQRSVDLYNQIQHKLAVDLPEDMARVNQNLADNARDQDLQKQVIAQNQLALKKLLFDHGQQIQNQQINIGNLESQLNNIQDNRVLGEPLRSIKPESLGRLTIIAIGIVASLLFALFMAVFADYIARVRVRLASG